AARIGDRDEQLKVDQVEAHGEASLPSLLPKAISVTSRLCRSRRSVNVSAMFEPFIILIAAVFLLAGFVKGVLGLGLPTVSMGLLPVTMQPARALAFVMRPAGTTNSG